jgi:hypothetical protein
MSLLRTLRNAAVELLLRDPRAQRAERGIEDCKLVLGQQEARARRGITPGSLADVEFRVFSQFGDDGIIEFLASIASDVPQSFVEFGVGDYTESNTRFLLMNRHWRGLICDGNRRLAARIRKDPVAWQNGLTVVDEFVTRDNINAIVERHGFTGPIGLLSIDLDGNDYYLWEALTAVSPSIVVMEYNAVFGPEAAVTVPYDAAFQRFAGHYSGLYWGASLRALQAMAARKGLEFLGCNSAGNNAYFVAPSIASRVPPALRAGAFVDARFRDSRGERGELTGLSGESRLELIGALPVVDVASGRTHALRDIARKTR